MRSSRFGRYLLALGNLLLPAATPAADPFPPPPWEQARHLNIYAEPGRFGGWPANHGVWIWGNEILVGLSAGYFQDNGPEIHAIHHGKPEEHLLARSLDGGESWSLENPSLEGSLIPVGKALHGITPPGLKERPWLDCDEPIDFQHPDLALTFRMTDHHAGPSRFSYSYDRGKHWRGPYRLQVNGPDGKPLAIAARTSYIVNSRSECVAFLTCAKPNGREGRVFCAKTMDGGQHWEFVAWIGEQPGGYSIMPSAVRSASHQMLCAVRRRESSGSWIELFRSSDEGQSWTLDNPAIAPTGEGNPPSLIRLQDGRLCLTYGFRAKPYAIRTRLSDDDGRNWSREMTLRGDAGGRDIGYPVSVQRPDGKVVTIYYFHTQPVSERFIAATIWDPSQPIP